MYFLDRSSVRQRRNPKETADLTSIHELIAEIDSNCHSGTLVLFYLLVCFSFTIFIGLLYGGSLLLMFFFFVGMLDIVRHCTYIGMADDVFALLQHDTHLYLANVVSLRYMQL